MFLMFKNNVLSFRNKFRKDKENNKQFNKNTFANNKFKTQFTY